MGPTWGPPGSCRPQMGPMLAPWTLLSGWFGPDNDLAPNRWQSITWTNDCLAYCRKYDPRSFDGIKGEIAVYIYSFCKRLDILFLETISVFFQRNVITRYISFCMSWFHVWWPMVYLTRCALPKYYETTANQSFNRLYTIWNEMSHNAIIFISHVTMP